MSEGVAKGFGEKPRPKKEERRKFQAIKGTRDLLPPETASWNRVEQTAHEVFTSYGFGEIRLPVIETLGLFARSLGTETDIVGKEMFLLAGQEPSVVVPPGRFAPPPQSEQARRDDVQRVSSEPSMRESVEPQIEESVLALRPEATASVCRAYIEHNMNQLPQPVKLYYMGPMFRRERPQKGRYRQFYQIGAEVLGGSNAPGIDAELIEMVMTFFERLRLEGVRLHINSIGDKNCRPNYVELLREELRKVKDKLGPDSQRRIETNPLRVLDSKLESEQGIIEKLPRIAQHLCDACREDYDEMKRQLALRGVGYSQNFRLVRGLDYYMRTTFEITAKGLGSQNAVCGGGRYDGLVEMLGGPPTKGIGFAIGEDRLILSLQEEEKTPAPQGRDVYIAWMGEKAYTTAIRAAKSLRAAGLSVELPPVEQKFGKALGQADKLGARYALILGDNEVESDEWTLKTLATGEQAKFTEAALLEFLRAQRTRSP
ncbi:MAG TPA: histidine--tRNA ligase [Candidatus Dormibacteraeota bacterium]|nr:histidine--tRNA ligase [Candidatus Dormibacteraeota bacterium]